MNLGLFLILLSFKSGMLLSGNIWYVENENQNICHGIGNTYYIEFQIEAQILKCIFIRGIINNLFNRVKDQINFSPDHDTYIFNAGIKFNFFEIGYLHRCYHPIIPYANDKYKKVALLEGSYDEIYITIETKIGK